MSIKTVKKFSSFISTLVLSIFLLFILNDRAFADTNPSSSAVSSVITAAINQQNIYPQTFERIDSFMSLPEDERLLMRASNKYAYNGAGQQVFSPTFLPDEKAGIWVKNFNLFENIPLNNGPNVSNVAYGTILGYDTDLKHFKNGWDGGLTFHGTYQGSRENFKETSSIDNVGNAGVTAALFKKNFFTAATAIVGGDYTYENVGRGEQNYRIFIAGLASKTGYNFEFKRGRYILQPSFLGIYTYALPSEFISSEGQSVTGDPLNVIHISPSIKAIGNFKNGLQPYLVFSLVWTLMDSPAIYKNGVLQQRVSIDPYCEYGFGVQKKWEDKYTGFGQVLMRGGGRNGVSIYLGLRMAMGGDKTSIQSKKTK